MTIYVLQFLGNLKRQRPSQTAIIDTSFRVERGRVILVPARLTNSYSKVVVCVDEKCTDSEVQRVKSVETYDRRRFITPSGRLRDTSYVKYHDGSIYIYICKPCRSRFGALDRKIICTHCLIVVGAIIECTG